MKNALLVLMLLTVAPNAHAYLDPGSGMGILQVMVAAVAGLAYTLKLYWQRIKLFLSNLFGQRPKDRGEGE